MHNPQSTPSLAPAPLAVLQLDLKVFSRSVLTRLGLTQRFKVSNPQSERLSV